MKPDDAPHFRPASAIVGVSDHCGWAVLVTVADDATLLDRRRVELVDEGLPKLPHHCEGQALPVPEAVALVERVRASAERLARACHDELANDVTTAIGTIALRACPALPDTVEERLADYRAQNVADTVMYRTALANAASDCGWRVSWYDAKRVVDDAEEALPGTCVEELIATTGAELGPPWRKDHRTGMAAAIAARGETAPRRRRR